jgi:hypothetical protein
MEQTSHHPPITNFDMDGPAELPFKLHGYFEFKLGLKNGFTCATFRAPGKIVLRLPNGSEYNMTSRTVEVTGLMSSVKNLNIVG